jgi:glycosyltransferase involved in cell wall biosynthesis
METPLRIAVMLRTLDEKGGIGVYSQNLTRELLDRDQHNHYILLYRNESHCGRFGDRPNVTELVLRARSRVFWDQWAVPRACRQQQVDVIFHPKFSVPLLTSCSTVMVLHGAGWFIPEVRKFWRRSDLIYARLMMPLYCRKAAAVISVSELTTDVVERILHIPPGKLHTIYFGPGKQFHRVCDQNEIDRVRAKYGLPERFILTLSGYDRGQRKNIGAILAAYRAYYREGAHPLIVCGKGCDRFREDYQLPNDGYGKNIVFPGWVEQEDLPVFYTLADVFLYPSNMEAHPIPITEAMACGTPIITSNAYGLKELAGNAALLVDPGNPAEIASALRDTLENEELRRDLAARGCDRSRLFTWQRCGEKTLEILKQAVERRTRDRANPLRTRPTRFIERDQ